MEFSEGNNNASKCSIISEDAVPLNVNAHNITSPKLPDVEDDVLLSNTKHSAASSSTDDEQTETADNPMLSSLAKCESNKVRRNLLGLKLLIEADAKLESDVEMKNQTLWNLEGPEDSSPSSPVSTVSGSSLASAEDSGFSSDENRSSEKTHKLSRTKSLRSALRSPKETVNAGTRKTVRFADSLGLDLVQKTYFETDDFRDIESYDFQSPLSYGQQQSPTRSNLVRLNPVNIVARSEAEISHLTRTQRVCLYSMNIIDTNISGVIHVLNLACDKQICVRYTSDNWITFSEVRAIFTCSVGSDGAVDSFGFFLSLPSDIPVGAVCEFCIRYSVNGASYWDNNGFQNYILQCVEDVAEEVPVVQEPVSKSIGNKLGWGRKNSSDSNRRSFLSFDNDDDYYFYTPSFNLHSSKKGFSEQCFGPPYGDHFHFPY